MSEHDNAIRDELGLNTDVYDDGYLRLEHGNYYIACGGEQVTLPRKEFLILSRLARNPQRIVRTDELWKYAWGAGVPLNPGSLRVHISRLRHTCAPYGLRIESLAGVGYRLMPSSTSPERGISPMPTAVLTPS